MSVGYLQNLDPRFKSGRRLQLLLKNSKISSGPVAEKRPNFSLSLAYAAMFES